MKKLSASISAVTILGLLLLLGISAVADVNTASAITGVGVQVGETSLGDLVADALKNSAKSSVAVVAAGSLKETEIPAGSVKPADVVNCLQYPYDKDKIVVLELTGKQILSALERSVRINPQKNMGFLQVSGLKVAFDPSAAKGSRIISVEVNKQTLDEAKKYSVAMPVPLADGEYGYFTIWGKEKQKPVKDTSISGAVSEFLVSKTSIDYKELNRIIPKKD